MTTCSKNFDRLLQASCLGLVGILAVAGCGGSSSTSTVDASKTQDGNGSLNGPDSGNVIPPAGTLTIDKVSIPFGSIDVGATSDAQTVTVTNSGTQAVAIAPSISSGSGAFAISSNCASVPAATGTVPGTCQISITFAPTATGNQTAILTVTSTLTVALKGDGVPPGSFDVANVNLGSQVLTNTAVTGAVTVTITGNVTDLACSVSGADLTADSTKVCPAVLPAGGSCTVGFTFKATTPGPKSDSVTCNAAGVHKTAVVSATVVDTAKLAITPATGSFQTQNGVQSADVPFGVANVGGLSTGTIQATITGTNADQFLISVPGCLAPLAGTTGCSLEVACKPTSVGTKTASLSVADSSGAAATVTAALTCVSVGPTSLTVTGTANLGSVVIGSTGTPQNFTVKNTGTTNSGTLTVTLSDTADFVKGSDGCNGASLDPNATCSIVVSLRPASAGALNAILNVAAASGNPGSIQLTGVGLTAGALTLSGSSYDFGPIPIGSASADVSFTVTNGGGAATGALTVSSPGNGFIVAGNGCSAALAPGKTCVFAIHFAPTVEGNATGTVTVGDLTVVSQPLTLHGTGTPTATLTIDPTSTCAAPEDLPTIPPPPASVGQNHALHETPSCGSSFPATVIGQTNGSYGAGGTGGAGGTSGSAGSSGSNTGIMFAVTNAGDIDTGAVTVKITGDASGDFVVVNNQCGANIVKSLDCIFYVNFTPTAAGARTATLTVTTVKGGNATVSLNGLGLPVIEILPCSNADGTIVGSEDIAGTSLINDDSDSSNWYAVYKTCMPLDATGGTDFGQVPLGVLQPYRIPNQEKAFAVRVRGSSAANHMNTLTLSLTSTAPDFSVATANESGGKLSNVNCQGFQADVTSGVQECIVLLDFYPQSTLGNKTGILTITGSAGGSATVNLSGTASGPLTFSSEALDTTKNAITFPDTEVGTVKLDESADLITETVVVTNYGTTAQGPLSFTVTGANSAEFATVMDNCSDKTLDAFGCSKSTETDLCNSCSMSFIMIPASAGAKTALLTVTSGTLSSQVTFSGNGTQGQTSTNPISVAPTSKDFGNVAIKAPSAYQTFTVTLSGTTETGDIDYGLWGTNCVNSAYACNGFEIAQAAGSGPDAVGTCGISDTRHLGGANPTSCTIKVRFNPAALQDGTAGLDPNDVGLWVEEMRSEQEVDIGLTGVATPQLVISPSTYDFTTGIPSGQTSTIVTFTVTNVGASPYIQADSLVYSIAGEGSAPLNTNGASTTCGTSLDAGAKCYVAVSITAPKLDDAANPPEITRDISTTLYVGDAGGAACTICGNATITATVVKPPTIEVVGFTNGLATYGNTVDFGTVPQGGSSNNVTIWYQNTGAVAATGFHYLWTDQSESPIVAPLLSQDANDPYFPFISDSSSTACVNQNGTNLASLAPGGLCTATFHLSALSGAVSKAYMAQLDIWADNATHAKSITAVGHSTPNTGVPTITPSFFNFSPTTSTASGQKTAAQAYVLKAGTTAIPSASVAALVSITDFDVALNPGGATPCSDYTTGTPLAAGGSCNFSVTFHPASSGPDQYRLGSISIGPGDATNSAVAGFIGKVSKPANLVIIDPTTTGTDFGDVLWNTKSAAMTLTITNTGEVASDAVTLAVGALDSGHAELSPEPNEVTAGYFAPSTNCNGVINPGATCSFTLTVQPGTTGQFPSVAGSIVVEARPAGWPGNAAEAWSGPVTARGVNAAALSLRPLNPPAFPDQPVGSVDGTDYAVFTIQNGNASAPSPTQASGPVTITIDDTTDYVLSTGGKGGCTTEMDPNGPGLGDPNTPTGQCRVGISFKPSLTTTLGNHPVNLTVTSKTKTGVTLSATVQVAGKVVAPLAFVIKEDVQDPNYPLFAPLAGATTDFGSINANAVTSSDPTTGFQVGDPGVVQLWVQDSWAAPDTGLLTTTLSGAGFRIIWNNCVGVQLGYDNDGSQFCDVGIRFEPTSAGAKSGTLVVAGTPGGSVTMALTGTGL